MADDELSVVLAQLGELLAEGVDDEDDALEIAALAGLAERLGADKTALADALAWRDGPGADVLVTAWDQLDTDEITDAIEGCLGGDVTEEALEEAIFDLDELVCAAIWCGQGARVRGLAAAVEETIRLVPETFAPLAPYGADIARLPTVAHHFDLYGFWLAIADATAD